MDRLGLVKAIDCLGRGVDAAVVGTAVRWFTSRRGARHILINAVRSIPPVIIDPILDILADPVERTAAAGAGIGLDIHDLPDPFEMRRQQATVVLRIR